MSPSGYVCRIILFVSILLLPNTINVMNIIIRAETNLPTHIHSLMSNHNSSNSAIVDNVVGISEKNVSSTDTLANDHKNSEVIIDTIIDSTTPSTYDISQHSRRLAQEMQTFQSQLILENMPLFHFCSDISHLINDTINLSKYVNTNHQGYDTTGHLHDLLTLETIFYDYLNLLRDYYFNLFEAKLKNYETDANDEDNNNNDSAEAFQQRVQYYDEMKAYMTNEFYSALKASQPDVPECRSWNIEGFLVELRDDMDACITDKIAPYARQIGIATSSSSNSQQQYDEDQSSSTLSVNGITITSTNNTTINSNKNSNNKSLTQWKKKRRLFSFSLPDNIILPRFIKRIIRHKKAAKYGKWLALQSLLFGVNFLQNEVHRRSALYAAEKRHAEVPPFPLL